MEDYSPTPRDYVPDIDDFPTEVIDRLPHYEEEADVPFEALFSYDFANETERQLVLGNSMKALEEGRMQDVDYRLMSFFPPGENASKTKFKYNIQCNEKFYTDLACDLIFKRPLPDYSKEQWVNIIRLWHDLSFYPDEGVIDIITKNDKFSLEEKKCLLREKLADRTIDDFGLFRLTEIYNVLGNDEVLIRSAATISPDILARNVQSNDKQTISILENLLGTDVIRSILLQIKSPLTLRKVLTCPKGEEPFSLDKYISFEELTNLANDVLIKGPDKTLSGIKEYLILCSIPRLAQDAMGRLTVFLRLSSIDYSRGGGIESLISLREQVNNLAMNADITDPIFRDMITLLPRGGNGNEVEFVRQQAIKIEQVGSWKLEVIRQMIHNFPGPENLKVMEALKSFLEKKQGQKNSIY